MMRSILFCSLILILGAISPVRAEDHSGLGSIGGRSIADPSSPAKLYNLSNACSAARPGLGSTGGIPTGSGGSALFQSRCLGCHGMKDAQKSVACIQGSCQANINGQIVNQMPPPPASPLSPDEQKAIIGFLMTNGR